MHDSSRHFVALPETSQASAGSVLIADRVVRLVDPARSMSPEK
jgi:hypothetical protein